MDSAFVWYKWHEQSPFDDARPTFWLSDDFQLRASGAKREQRWSKQVDGKRVFGGRYGVWRSEPNEWWGHLAVLDRNGRHIYGYNPCVEKSFPSAAEAKSWAQDDCAKREGVKLENQVGTRSEPRFGRSARWRSLLGAPLL